MNIENFMQRGLAAQKAVDREIKKAQRIRKCQRCGCTDDRACLDGRLMQPCCWVERDICSACLTHAEFVRFIRGIKPVILEGRRPRRRSRRPA